jgi:hypothetical protein
VTEKRVHDPSAKLDYLIKVSKWLPAGDILTDVDVSIYDSTTNTESTAIVVEPVTFTTNEILMWIATTTGVVVGKSYTITTHFTTQDGREDDYSFTLQIKEK